MLVWAATWVGGGPKARRICYPEWRGVIVNCNVCRESGPGVIIGYACLAIIDGLRERRSAENYYAVNFGIWWETPLLIAQMGGVRCLICHRRRTGADKGALPIILFR